MSQCIYSGCNIMNYSQNGWYYKNANDKSPSWTGVTFLHDFLVRNKSVGPFGRLVDIQNLEIGDVVQLSFNENNFSHSLIVVEKLGDSLENILVATHTFDSYGRNMSTYNYEQIRFIHIDGIRTW